MSSQPPRSATPRDVAEKSTAWDAAKTIECRQYRRINLGGLAPLHWSPATCSSNEPLAALPLRALTRMTVTSRYPLDDTPPVDLFDPADADAAIATAEAVLRWVEQLDQPGGEG